MRQHFSETTGPQRLVYGLLAGIAAGAVPLPTSWQFRSLFGWSVGVIVYLALAWRLCVVFDAKRTRQRAQAQDEPSVVLFMVLLLATVACVAAIAVLIQHSRDLTGMQRGLHLGLSVIALGSSWLFIQTVFTFRYAHRYYQEEKTKGTGRAWLAVPRWTGPRLF